MLLLIACLLAAPISRKVRPPFVLAFHCSHAYSVCGSIYLPFSLSSPAWTFIIARPQFQGYIPMLRLTNGFASNTFSAHSIPLPSMPYAAPPSKVSALSSSGAGACSARRVFCESCAAQTHCPLLSPSPITGI